MVLSFFLSLKSGVLKLNKYHLSVWIILLFVISNHFGKWFQSIFYLILLSLVLPSVNSSPELSPRFFRCSPLGVVLDCLTFCIDVHFSEKMHFPTTQLWCFYLSVLIWLHFCTISSGNRVASGSNSLNFQGICLYFLR